MTKAFRETLFKAIPVFFAAKTKVHNTISARVEKYASIMLLTLIGVLLLIGLGFAASYHKISKVSEKLSSTQSSIMNKILTQDQVMTGLDTKNKGLTYKLNILEHRLTIEEQKINGMNRQIDLLRKTITGYPGGDDEKKKK